MSETSEESGTWTPAKPGDTPGQVEPDDAQPQPIDIRSEIEGLLVRFTNLPEIQAKILSRILARALRLDDRLDALYAAWGIIANAGQGDWSCETPEWQAAAARWRDEQFHPLLKLFPDTPETPVTS